MRVLLIAYEFPPVIAAQSLRWYYLANELAKLGVEVHVVCPAFRGLDVFEGDFHRGVHLHRIWPGPFIGLSQWLRGEIQQDGVTAQKEAATQGWSAFAWRLYRIVRQVLNHVLFPDLRTEWFPFAFYKALALSRSYRFDCMIASHEPGVDIFIGLALKKMSTPGSCEAFICIEYGRGPSSG